MSDDHQNPESNSAEESQFGDTFLDPKPTDAQVNQLAPHHLRLFALILDYLGAMMVLKAAAMATLAGDWDVRPAPEWLNADGLNGFGFMFLLLIFRDVWDGQSIGKRITGIAVRSASDLAQVPSFQNLVKRNLALLLAPVEAVLVFTDPYCRRLGDKWGQSVVVIPEHQPSMARRMLLFAGIFLGFTLVAMVITKHNLQRTQVWKVGSHAALAQPAAQALVNPEVNQTEVLDLEPGKLGSQARLQFKIEGDKHGKVNLISTLRLDPAGWVLLGVEVAPDEKKTPPSGPLEQKPITDPSSPAPVNPKATK